NHSDWIVGLQDLGAAGLTSSAVEAADRGNSGIDIDVTLVPRRAENMSAYEVMLSESQERMLVIPHRKYLDEVIDYFKSWEINASEIGIVTSNGQVTIREKDVIVASMPVDIMTNPPMYTNDATIDPVVELLAREDLSLEPDIDPVMATDVLFDLLESENLSSRRWVYQQYDHQVLNNTVVKPGGDAAVLRIKELKQGLAVSTDCNGRAVYLNPQVGAALAVAEAARNVIATGARPVAVTDCLNFGNPEKSEVAYQLEKSIIGLSEASRVFETPVISGNASLYNETPDGQIMPTPTIGMLGVISDVTNRLTISPKVGNRVFLIGGLLEQSANTLAASEFQWLRTGRMAGSPSIDLKLAREIGDLVLLMHDEGLLSAAHDVGDGGIAVALIEMSFASGHGFRSKILDLGERLDAALFGEAPSRFLVATDQPDLVISLAGKYSIPVVELGEVETDNNFEFGPISVDLDIAYEKWNLGLNRVVEQDFIDEGSGDF
ncbi:MAG: AIR synthase-related protein, partial [Dehalococcoidia bacterium]|nr:AIR synthase-related protein [Dehalococcoidia bacterium]